MANRAYDEAAVQAIAAAIREKNGASDTYTIAQMAEAIRNIPSGGTDVRLLELLTRYNQEEGASFNTPFELDFSDIVGVNFPWIATPQFFLQKGSETSLITKVTFPASLHTISYHSFYCQEALTAVKALGEIREIGGYAFYGCTALHTLDISWLESEQAGSIVSIGDHAFSNCKTLTSFEFPNITELRIFDSAFQPCNNLGIAFPTTNNIYLSSSAFQSTGNTSIKIPSNVNMTLLRSNRTFGTSGKLKTAKVDTDMYSQTFYSCRALENVWIGAHCTTIGSTSQNDTPFNWCTALTDVYCEAAEKPAGWGEYWDYIKQDTRLTVHWGVSEAEFDAIVNA